MAESEKWNLFDALGKSLNEKTNKIVECSLDDTGADVATTIAGHIAKKLPENLKGDNKINILQNE